MVGSGGWLGRWVGYGTGSALFWHWFCTVLYTVYGTAAALARPVRTPPYMHSSPAAVGTGLAPPCHPAPWVHHPATLVSAVLHHGYTRCATRVAGGHWAHSWLHCGRHALGTSPGPLHLARLTR